jgi:hypothetical protein
MTHRIAVRAADVVNADGQLGLPLASLRTYLLAASAPIAGVASNLPAVTAGIHNGREFDCCTEWFDAGMVRATTIAGC